MSAGETFIAGDRNLAVAIEAWSDFRAALRVAFAELNGSMLARVFGIKFGILVDVAFDPSVAPLTFFWDRHHGGQGFRFSPDPSTLLITCDRWLAMCGVVEAMAKRGSPTGSAMVDLADCGRDGALCFCSASPEAILIPDSYFLSQQGYRVLRETPPAAWNERRAALLWRGSATGEPAEDVTTMARVKLCLVAQTLPGSDVGMTAPWFPNGNAIRELGLERPFVGWDRFGDYKYHVDIDGNSNSWPGLFTKLLSGGAVLKVESPLGFKQWYYGSLVPWVNYVPVRSDLADLAETYARLREDDALAEAIGGAGRALAMHLTYEAGIATTIEALERQFLTGRIIADNATEAHASNSLGPWPDT